MVLKPVPAFSPNENSAWWVTRCYTYSHTPACCSSKYEDLWLFFLLEKQQRFSHTCSHPPTFFEAAAVPSSRVHYFCHPKELQGQCLTAYPNFVWHSVEGHTWWRKNSSLRFGNVFTDQCSNWCRLFLPLCWHQILHNQCFALASLLVSPLSNVWGKLPRSSTPGKFSSRLSFYLSINSLISS